MKRFFKKVLGKENYKKVMLIKKYAKIRFNRFWNEWGFTKRDMLDILSCTMLFGSLTLLYIVGCMF